MRRVSDTSGDLVADRRYACGADLARAGDYAAAIPLLERAIERAPTWALAWRDLGRARRNCFDPEGAIAAFRECVKHDPADALGAGLELALLDPAASPRAAPAAYVVSLFNAYAPEFDKSLVERLAYAAPLRIAAAVRAMLRTRGCADFARALDLGCGTGLAGEAVRESVTYLEGVDLADGMLSVAREKGVYDALVCADMLEHLAASEDPFDLIIAADALTYVGDVSDLMKAIASRAAPGGIALLAVEKGGPADWTVLPSLRFAHSPDYLLRTAKEAGLVETFRENFVIRRDRGAEVDGVILLLNKD